MASIMNQEFPDEEEEDDFNPQPQDDSDDGGDAQSNTIDDDADDGPARNERTRRSPKEKDDSEKDPARAEDDAADDEELEADGNVEEEDDDDREDEEEDEEEEDEEDEEDDDIEGQPSKKRRRKHRTRNAFIDVEAEVDEDDEEEPDEDDELPGEGIHPDDLQELPPGAERDDRKHRELDQQREKEVQLDAEETAARLRERYGRQSRATGTAGAMVPQRLLLPSVEDPRIWRYKCRPGKEREIIATLNQRILDRANSRDPILIYSAFERGGVMAGNLYVEARNQDHIKNALDGISHVFMGTTPLMIPVEEMPDLLRTRKSKQLEPGMYVRIKRGLYQGDLAQVEEVESNGTEVTLRMVPRLDYGLNEDDNAPQPETEAGGKRKRIAKPFMQRPPPRLFSEAEAKKRHQRYLSRAAGLGNNIWNYQGKVYVDGFLTESFRVNALQTENVNPNLEEVTKFASGAEDGTENLDLVALAATLKHSAAADYLPGDHVELFKGEQKGVTGRAVQVYGEVVKMRVESRGALRGQTIEAPIKDLRKIFREGDHVKVIGGSKYVEEVGMVVRTKDDRVTILTDSNQQEVTVFSKDLREATDSGGDTSGSRYQIFDLVQLDASTVGCVVRVDRDSLRVVDQDGSLRTLLPSAISNKLERRRNAVATDRDGNEMKLDDTIKEHGGEQRSGRVLHLHRNFVFAQDRNRTENAGVFVTRHSNVLAIAAKGGRPGAPSGGLDLSKMNPAIKANGLPGGPGGNSMAPPIQRGRDKLVNKSVKCRQGPHKGLVGIVKDTSGDTAKVELHAKNKLVTINKTSLVLIDSRTGAYIGDVNSLAMGRPPPSAGGMAGRTPAAPSGGFGGRTPFGGGAAAGARTPSYAMASSGRTPTWKQDAGARTPAYGGGTAYGGGYGGGTSYGGATSYGGGTSYGGATSYGGGGGGGGGSVWGGNQSAWNPNPSSRTPAASGANGGAGGRTPAYGNYGSGLDAETPGFASAPTPGGAFDSATPGGFRASGAGGLQAQTPGGDFPETPGGRFDDGPGYD